ncbi:MAG: hypothetical protein WC482_02275 [Candidatus Omnitrophota bacterium]|nr:hypothetical protein [Candidatus Omnitrophota bacterium]
MIDKKTESDIKTVKSFLEFWVKFHSIYSGVISRDNISKEDEQKLLETKEIIKNKYEGLKGGLEFTYMPHGRLTDPVSDILKIDNIRFMAEKNLRKISGDWKDSYVFLNNILERLENKKRRLDQFNPMAVFVKKFFEEGITKRLRRVLK